MRDEGGDVLRGATAVARLVNGGKWAGAGRRLTAAGRYRGCDDVSPAPHRPRPRAPEDRRAPRLGRRCDRSPCCSTAPSAAARSPPYAGPTSISATATTSLSPSAARSPTRPGGVLMCDVWSADCAAAVRSLHAAVSPEPGDSVVGLSLDQINRRFAAACAAAGLEGRRTSHGGRVGLAVELTARGASKHAIQLAGGWKDPAMVVR